MNIVYKNIELIDCYVYLSVESGKERTFMTGAERNRKKFYAAINNILSHREFLY